MDRKLSVELDYKIRYDVEHDLFHAQNVFNDEYIKPTFIEYVQKLEKRNAELEAQIEKMKCCQNCENWNWKHSKCEKKLKGNCFKQSKWVLRRILSKEYE